MKPLYRFRPLEDGKIVEVVEVKEYEDRANWYRMTVNHNLMYIDKDKLDTLKNGRVWSFNPDPEHARQIMIADVQARKQKAYEEYLKWDKLVVNLSRGENT